MSRALLLILSVVCLLGGCASTPDVVYKYYPSQIHATATVTRTVDCTSDKTAVVIVNTPAINTVYMADYSQGPYSLRIKDLAGAIADSDLSFTFFDDGRLKSVNAWTTGQGEAVAKSAISLITAVAASGGAGGEPGKATPLPECTAISKWGGGKPVTLTYSTVIDFKKAAAGTDDLPATPQSQAISDQLKKVLPPLSVFLRSQKENDSGASYAGPTGNRDAVFLTLQRTLSAQVEIQSKGSSIFTTVLALPQPATYPLPIPKAAVFGKQSFSLTLADSGAITTVDYGKLSGASGGLSAATSAVGAAAPESTANKAAEMKAQADLIAQQQRLARCQAQPDKCT
jgi:hypothetical protein